MNTYEEDGLYELACSLIGREISALASQIDRLEKSTVADLADIAALLEQKRLLVWERQDLMPSDLDRLQAVIAQYGKQASTVTAKK